MASLNDCILLLVDTLHPPLDAVFSPAICLQLAGSESLTSRTLQSLVAGGCQRPLPQITELLTVHRPRVGSSLERVTWRNQNASSEDETVEHIRAARPEAWR